VTQSSWKVVNAGGADRVLVTVEVPGERRLELPVPTGYEDVDVAAATVAAILQERPVWPAVLDLADVRAFLEDEDPSQTAPSIVNADELGRAHRSSPRRQGGPSMTDVLPSLAWLIGRLKPWAEA
jgi:hypothetical protein